MTKNVELMVITKDVLIDNMCAIESVKTKEDACTILRISPETLDEDIVNRAYHRLCSYIRPDIDTSMRVRYCLEKIQEARDFLIRDLQMIKEVSISQVFAAAQDADKRDKFIAACLEEISLYDSYTAYYSKKDKTCMRYFDDEEEILKIFRDIHDRCESTKIMFENQREFSGTSSDARNTYKILKKYIQSQLHSVFEHLCKKYGLDINIVSSFLKKEDSDNEIVYLPGCFNYIEVFKRIAEQINLYKNRPSFNQISKFIYFIVFEKFRTDYNIEQKREETDKECNLMFDKLGYLDSEISRLREQISSVNNEELLKRFNDAFMVDGNSFETFEQYINYLLTQICIFRAIYGDCYRHYEKSESIESCELFLGNDGFLYVLHDMRMIGIKYEDKSQKYLEPEYEILYNEREVTLEDVQSDYIPLSVIAQNMGYCGKVYDNSIIAVDGLYQANFPYKDNGRIYTGLLFFYKERTNEELKWIIFQFFLGTPTILWRVKCELDKKTSKKYVNKEDFLRLLQYQVTKLIFTSQRRK